MHLKLKQETSPLSVNNTIQSKASARWWSCSFESRGIWQFPFTLWHSPLPCAPGMLGCLHYSHTGQRCGDEGGLVVESLSENTYTSRLAVRHRRSLRDNFPAQSRCHAGTEAHRVHFSQRPWKERESQNKDNRHNHQEKASAWRRNSLATVSHFLVRTDTALADSELFETQLLLMNSS